MRFGGRVFTGCIALALAAAPAMADNLWSPPPLSRSDSYDPFVQPVGDSQNGAAMDSSLESVIARTAGYMRPANSPTPAQLPTASSVQTVAQPIAQPTAPVQMSATASCGDTATSASTCPSCPTCGCCCDNLFENRCGAFVDFLYLRAYDIDMAHGIQQNGVGGLGTAPDGAVGTCVPQFAPGFRVGANFACDCDSGFSVDYMQYSDSSSNIIFAPAGIGGTTASLVLFPNTVTAASTFDFLSANYDIRFDIADVDYAVNLARNGWANLNYHIGVRYAHLDQGFEQLAEFSGATGEEQTNTDILFDGVGLRTGFDGEWRIHKSRFALYGKGTINVLFGQFSSNYRQYDVTTDTVEALSHWTDSRVVPILEYEAGINWTSCNDHFRVGAGYMTQFWFNAVDTAEFIQAVQNQSFTHVGQTIAFTGLVAHAEFQF